MRMRCASVLSDDPEIREKEMPTLHAVNWKVPHDFAMNGFVENLGIPDDFDIYNQSQRTAFPKPTPVCPVAYMDFRRHEKNEEKRMTKDAIKALMRNTYILLSKRLYDGVKDNTKKAVVAIVEEEEEEEVIEEEDEDEDDRGTPLDVVAVAVEPLPKKYRTDLSGE
jgi:hypothetical protein